MDFSKLLSICLLNFLFGVVVLEGHPKSKTRKKYFSSVRKRNIRSKQPVLSSEEWKQLHKFEDALKTEEGELLYTNSWAVKLVDPAEVEVADRIAEKHGFQNLGQVNKMLRVQICFELFEQILCEINIKQKHARNKCYCSK